MVEQTGIHMVHWGTAGPRVLMIHGGVQGTSSAGHRNFHAQEPLGAEGWRLIVPDRPGHGQSPNPGRGDDAEADGVWAQTLLDDGAHLVGHSFGGLVALAAASLRLDAVKSLVLIEPALQKVATKAPAVRKFLFGMATTLILPYSGAAKAQRIMKLIGIPKDFAREKTDLESLGRSLRRLKLPTRARMEGWLQSVRDRKIPFLIISGSSNPAYIATGGIAAPLGGGTHRVVPGEHHFPQWAGAPFNAVLVEFWKAAEARKA